jgi:hypothetical protein
MNIITSLSNFMKIYQAVQKFISGGQTDRHFGMIDVSVNAIATIQNFTQIHQSVQEVHPTHKFKRPPFLNG